MGNSLIIDSNFENIKMDSLRIGIVHSEWNSNITDMLMSSCTNYFLELGISTKNLPARPICVVNAAPFEPLSSLVTCTTIS